MSTLPPCADESQTAPDCYWDADTMGNGQGQDFIVVDGVVGYTDITVSDDYTPGFIPNTVTHAPVPMGPDFLPNTGGDMNAIAVAILGASILVAAGIAAIRHTITKGHRS